VRLTLYWRGYDLLDVELHLIRRRPDDDPPDHDGPALEAGGSLESSDRAEPYGDPATVVRFGFST
jgi:hypothetical protein